MFIIFFISMFISANAGDDQYGLINKPISLTACESISNEYTIFNWEFSSIPEDSSLNSQDIIPNESGNHECLASFTPDVVGIYKIKLTIKNNNDISEDWVQVIALNNLNKKRLLFDILRENNYYSYDFNYYETNIINYNIGVEKEIIYKNSKKGKYYLENLENSKIYEVATLDNFLFKAKTPYLVTFFSDGYKKVEKTIFSNKNLELDSIESSGVNLKVQNHLLEDINGIYTAYYDNKKVVSSYNPLSLDKDITSILFTPTKSEYNYPSIYYSKKIDNPKIIQYNELSYVELEIKTLEDVVVVIRSKTIDNCLNNEINATCIWEKRVSISQNSTIILPKGEYLIEKFKDGFKWGSSSVVMDRDKLIEVDLPNLEMVKINIPENVVALTLSGEENSFFFNKGDEIKIPKGSYDITLYTENGYYRLSSYVISGNEVLPSNERELSLIFDIYSENKLQDENIFSDLFIFENGYYIFPEDYNIDLIVP